MPRADTRAGARRRGRSCYGSPMSADRRASPPRRARPRAGAGGLREDGGPARRRTPPRRGRHRPQPVPRARGAAERCGADRAGSSRGRTSWRCSSGCAWAGATETSSELGLSHYLEHMLFKGTPDAPARLDRHAHRGLRRQQQRLHLVRLHALRRARARRPRATGRGAPGRHRGQRAASVPAELEAEKKVVFERRCNLLQDDPEKFLTRRLSETVYVGIPYGRPILGTARARMRDLTREQLNAYHEAALRPPEHGAGRGRRRCRRPGRARAGHSRCSASCSPRPCPPRPRRADPVAGAARPSRRRARSGAGGRARPGRGRLPPRGSPRTDMTAVDLLTYILGDAPQLAAEPDGARGRAAGAVDRRRLPSRCEQSGHRRHHRPARTPRTSTRAQAAILDVIRQVRAEGVTEAERQRAIITAEASLRASTSRRPRGWPGPTARPRRRGPCPTSSRI